MLRSLIPAVAASVLFTTSAAAQDMLREQAEPLLLGAGIEIALPEDATDEQLTLVIALLQGPDGKAATVEPQVTDLLGME